MARLHDFSARARFECVELWKHLNELSAQGDWNDYGKSTTNRELITGVARETDRNDSNESRVDGILLTSLSRRRQNVPVG